MAKEYLTRLLKSHLQVKIFENVSEVDAYLKCKRRHKLVTENAIYIVKVVVKPENTGCLFNSRAGASLSVQTVNKELDEPYCGMSTDIFICLDFC